MKEITKNKVTIANWKSYWTFLLFLVVVSMAGMSVVFFFVSRKEAKIAPQELSAKGNIVAHRKGRSGTSYDYTFVVDGREYKGHDYPTDSVVADRYNVSVYYYTTDPSQNSLTEFGAMSARHNRAAIRFVIVALGIMVLGIIIVSLVGRAGE